MYRYLKNLHSNKSQNEYGFTLVEITVAVVIIGIIAAIAIPVTINARNSANENDVKVEVVRLAGVLSSSATATNGYYVSSRGPQILATEARPGYTATYNGQGTNFEVTYKGTSNTLATSGFCVTLRKDNITMSYTSTGQVARKGGC